jgi:hypothetical protein
MDSKGRRTQRRAQERAASKIPDAEKKRLRHLENLEKDKQRTLARKIGKR